MPTRISIVTIPTPVQGDDAWVKIKRPTVGEMEEMYERYRIAVTPSQSPENGGGIDPQVAMRDELLNRFVQEWNWVDDDGLPLPQIKNDPSVIRKLLSNEIDALYQAITMQDDNKKKG